MLPPSFHLHRPPLPLPFGTHHTKAFLLGRRASLSVIIHTANLIAVDWQFKSQGLWQQTFLVKRRGSGGVERDGGAVEGSGKGWGEAVLAECLGRQRQEDMCELTPRSCSESHGEEFEDDLVRYFGSLGWRGCQVVVTSEEGEEGVGGKWGGEGEARFERGDSEKSARRGEGKGEGSGSGDAARADKGKGKGKEKVHERQYWLEAEYLRRYDFSSAAVSAFELTQSRPVVSLIASVPGYHAVHPLPSHRQLHQKQHHHHHQQQQKNKQQQQQQHNHWGHLALRQKLSSHRCLPPFTSSSSAATVLQVSSLGSLTSDWLYHQFLPSLAPPPPPPPPPPTTPHTLSTQAQQQQQQHQQQQQFQQQKQSSTTRKRGNATNATTASSSKNTQPPTQTTSNPSPPKPRIVWPTQEEVRESLQGYAAGGSICGPARNVDKPFLAPLWCPWGGREAGRARAMPHMKTYCVVEGGGGQGGGGEGGGGEGGAGREEERRDRSGKGSGDEKSEERREERGEGRGEETDAREGRLKGVRARSGEAGREREEDVCASSAPRLGWVLLTSANLSAAAWGTVQKGRQRGKQEQQQQQQQQQKLVIRSYELGVLFLPCQVNAFIHHHVLRHHHALTHAPSCAHAHAHTQQQHHHHHQRHQQQQPAIEFVASPWNLLRERRANDGVKRGDAGERRKEEDRERGQQQQQRLPACQCMQHGRSIHRPPAIEFVTSPWNLLRERRANDGVTRGDRGERRREEDGERRRDRDGEGRRVEVGEAMGVRASGVVEGEDGRMCVFFPLPFDLPPSPLVTSAGKSLE
ncbi:unnamed protein product [Closterium sp. NIES-54]